MPVDNTSVIDSISLDKDGNVVLTISDHLPWDDKNEHLMILQNKINAYLAFIENGELIENYPDADGKPVVINIITKYLPTDNAEIFIKRTRQILEERGYKLKLMLIENQ
jgi:hypothetical protein